MKNQVLSGFMSLLLTIFLCTCDRAHPVSIAYGMDQCEFCRMAIVEVNYGAELITEKGRVMKYDAAECMVNHLAQEEIAVQKLYAVPYDQPATLRPVDSLFFVIDASVRSPMGANLAAFSSEGALPKDVIPLDWATVAQMLTK
ncbi:nitrous oxide reductase accessory protein NosL [Neolewinella antarctica]|uniref:Copper chaperone NosL n=1 Tax=Neolewinella antarctica TaxID=442734 RepID=A0ABX0XCH7_9BACT|nr:nitrous oxide reductase accessory protein NosL [Neolewinella antarctica]NJC26978.1 copper chaperone NosL [Neolewinella antarctica]